MKKPILFDVDGVCADWIGAVLDYSNNKNETNWTRDQIEKDIRTYDVWDDGCEELVKSPGFNRTLKELEPGCTAVRHFLKNPDYKVMFLTSPYHMATTWAHDRICWLHDHFGVTRDDVIIARSKQYIDGIVLVDDLPKNVKNWSDYNKKPAILMDQPWNRNQEARKFGSYRAKTSEGLINMIERAAR